MSDEELRAHMRELEAREADGTITWTEKVVLDRQRHREWFLDMVCVYPYERLTGGDR